MNHFLCPITLNQTQNEEAIWGNSSDLVSYEGQPSATYIPERSEIFKKLLAEHNLLLQKWLFSRWKRDC
jgi:hypothetical protein